MPAAAARWMVLLVVGCTLAGCGSGNPYALQKYDPNASSTSSVGSAASSTSAGSAGSSGSASQRGSRPTVSRTPTPPQVKYRPADALGEGAWVERGRIKAGTAEDRAIVSAMTTYMSVRVQLSNTWQVDVPALAAVASGEAFTSAQARAARQRKRDWRSIGRFVINVSSVTVDGSHAAVTGCHFDGTSEVDENGGVVLAPPGGVLITMKLQRTGGVWRVVDWPDQIVPVCDSWRA